MAKLKIIWSRNAENELFETLEYFAERNKSTTYSKKLNSKIKSALSNLAKQPQIGKAIQAENCRGIYIDDYLLVYEFDDLLLEILLFWDTRRDPNILEDRLNKIV